MLILRINFKFQFSQYACLWEQVGFLLRRSLMVFTITNPIIGATLVITVIGLTPYWTTVYGSYCRGYTKLQYPVNSLKYGYS